MVSTHRHVDRPIVYCRKMAFLIRFFFFRKNLWVWGFWLRSSNLKESFGDYRRWMGFKFMRGRWSCLGLGHLREPSCLFCMPHFKGTAQPRTRPLWNSTRVLWLHIGHATCTKEPGLIWQRRKNTNQWIYLKILVLSFVCELTPSKSAYKKNRGGLFRQSHSNHSIYVFMDVQKLDHIWHLTCTKNNSEIGLASAICVVHSLATSISWLLGRY